MLNYVSITAEDEAKTVILFRIIRAAIQHSWVLERPSNSMLEIRMTLSRCFVLSLRMIS